MDTSRLRHLAGVEPQTQMLSEERQQQQTLTYNGFRLTQQKEVHGDSWEIRHTISKNGKHLTTLDHNPREWIDEKAFKKYVEYYQKHGHFPSRDHVEGQGTVTNDKIINLKEDDQGGDRSGQHFKREQSLFTDTIKQLHSLQQFVQQQSGRDYENMRQLAAKLQQQMQQHLDKYKD